MQGRAAAGLCISLLLPGLAGCAAVTHPLRTARLAPRDLTLHLTIDKDANGNSVVPMDLVAVEQKKLLPEIAALTATQWFDKKNDYLRMRGKDLRVVSWEFVPGSIVEDQHVTASLDKAGVFLFARYTGKGAFRATLPDDGVVQVHLQQDGFTVVDPKSAGVAAAPDKK